MEDNKNYCCDVMESVLERGDSALCYDDQKHVYVLREAIIKDNRILWTSFEAVLYCPWCGKKLLYTHLES